MKKSGRSDAALVYKGSDPSGQNGNSGFTGRLQSEDAAVQLDMTHGPPPWEPSWPTRTGPVEADGAVDAQNAPTAPWKTRSVFHELPQGFSHQITHEKHRKAPK